VHYVDSGAARAQLGTQQRRGRRASQTPNVEKCCAHAPLGSSRMHARPPTARPPCTALVMSQSAPGQRTGAPCVHLGIYARGLAGVGPPPAPHCCCGRVLRQQAPSAACGATAPNMVPSAAQFTSIPPPNCSHKVLQGAHMFDPDKVLSFTSWLVAGVHRQSHRSSIVDALNVTPRTHLVRIPCVVNAKCDIRSPIVVSFRPPHDAIR
jgi:hypothetical protein